MTQPPRSSIRVPLPGPDAELLTAICTICDGQPTRADFDRLERLLQDPGAMTVYLAVTELDATLLWKLRGQSHWRAPDLPGLATSSTPAPTPSAKPPAPRRAPGPLQGAATTPGDAATRRSRPPILRRPPPLFLRMIGILLAVVLIGGVVASFQPARTPPAEVPPSPRLPGSVACVTAMHGTAWSDVAGDADPTAHPALFDSLFPGKQLVLRRGLVGITFDSGAELILEGPVACEVTSSSAVRLDRGRLTATVHAQASAGTAETRFTVKTPTATVTDVGTAFGVAVDGTGLTDVRVFEGFVDLLASHGAPSPPVRLMRDESGSITTTGRVSRRSSPGGTTFKRSMPQGTSSASTGPAPTVWADTKAKVVFRDGFGGSGRLEGTTPSSRNGTGDAPWRTPAAGWDLAADGLSAASPGKAWLPFAPQPGRIYRLQVEMTVTAGANDWAAIGFSAPPAPENPAMNVAWILQRHTTELDANLIFFGAGLNNLRILNGDNLTGRRTLAILLDTTQPRWAVTFLADGRPLGGGVLPTDARIDSACLSCQGSAHVTFHTSSLLVMESAHGSRN